MRFFLTLFALVAAIAPAAHGRESLREILHPRADLPAFRCVLPAEWTSTVDPAGNLRIANGPSTATFSLGIAHSSNAPEALDLLARTILADAIVPPWETREPTEISGHRGCKYTARVRAPNGVEVRAELILVAVNDEHVASCSMILARRVNADDELLARLVFASVKLLPSR